MKANETSFLQLLNGNKQFVIPIYQRTYSWTRSQCAQLWADIQRAADENIAAHFVGSVVYIQDGLFTAASTPQLLVIDGQQRLTTLSLLLVALARALEASNEVLPITHDELYDYYLVNAHRKGVDKYKLLLTRSDRETLISLISGLEPSANASKRIQENYHSFQDWMARPDTDLLQLYRGIMKLMIVEISLDRAHDNPQLIFESLNSTGLDLSQADLIRNYVLMGLGVDEQEQLYNDYWYRMEESFGSNYAAHFDYFMRDFLTLKSRSGAIPKLGEVYAKFKEYRQGHTALSIQDIVADVYRYARYYTQLALEQDGDHDINAAAHDINTLEVDVAYPFLLELYDDFARHHLLSRQDFLTILRLVESYVFRRAICDIPTNSLNKTFATLTRDLDKSNYLASFQAMLLLKDSYRRFPQDVEFRRAFTTRNIYDLSKRRRYLFGKLENYHHREPINVNEYTIEHILPQNENLSPEWQVMLGQDWKQVQTTYLHTIGNLTLTAYNSSLSDRLFTEKRDMQGGFRDSHLRLNADLAALDEWNAATIVERASRLADLAIHIWPVPNLALEDARRLVTSQSGASTVGSSQLVPAFVFAGGSYSEEDEDV